MKNVREHDFGDVKAFEIDSGGILGRPVMTVFVYVVGDNLIDTGHSLARKAVLECIKGFDIKNQ